MQQERMDGVVSTWVEQAADARPGAVSTWAEQGEQAEQAEEGEEGEQAEQAEQASDGRPGAVSAWAPQSDRASGDLPIDWRVVHRALRGIARRRAGLDAEEARWLREAEALQIWREVGMVSAQDYMERVLGYGPRTAQERLRVARALGGLPRLSAALAEGELAYSAVRELSRVATSTTEDEWLAHARGKNLRQIEELVADHHLGDRPEDPKDPRARMQVVRLELSAETYALFRQARQVLDNEHGTSLSEDQLITQLCNAVLDGGSASEPTGRAKFQVAVTVCERCQQGWQHGAGAKIAIGAAAVERAMCDAQQIGSIDGDVPARAYQDISPSVARFVWHRDGGRCRVPGCRSARGIELHHLVRRVDGGSHDPSNLVLLCSACHASHHAGTLAITGSAAHIKVVRPADVRVLDAADAVARRTATAREAAASGMRSDRRVANPGAHVGQGRAEQGTEAEQDAFCVGRAGEPGSAAGGGGAGGSKRDAAEPGAEASAALKQMGDGEAGAKLDAAEPGVEASAALKQMGDGGAGPKLDAAELGVEASAALKQMGWAPAVVRSAVRAAAAVLGSRATLEQLLVEALRRCPRPASTTSPMREGSSESV